MHRRHFLATGLGGIVAATASGAAADDRPTEDGPQSEQAKMGGAADPAGVKLNVKPVMSRAARNSTTNRWGHTWTLSWGWALTSWMDPDLTTVSSRWVWPPGPVAVGAGPAAAGGGAVAVVAGVAAPASSPLALALAALERI